MLTYVVQCPAGMAGHWFFARRYLAPQIASFM